MTDINFKSPMIRDIVYFYATNRVNVANTLICAFIDEQGARAHSEFWWLVFVGLLETADLKG